MGRTLRGLTPIFKVHIFCIYFVYTEMRAAKKGLAHARACVCVRIRKHACVSKAQCKCNCNCICMSICSCLCSCMRICSRICAHMHTHMRLHMHAYACVCAKFVYFLTYEMILLITIGLIFTRFANPSHKNTLNWLINRRCWAFST